MTREMAILIGIIIIILMVINCILGVAKKSFIECCPCKKRSSDDDDEIDVDSFFQRV